MNKIWLVYALLGIMLGTVSCSKDEGDKIEEIDIIGTWTASSGKYNLSLKITSSSYDFLLSEPGKGGVTDKGTYEISNEGKIVFTNKSDVLAMGYLRNEKLSLTFVNSIAIIMLGKEAASNITFILSEDENGDDDSGYLVIQNLSDNYDIVLFKFYDEKGNFLDSDSDVLEPDYQITYEVEVGSYFAEITDDRGKSFKSKLFKVVADKSTVLAYSGSAIEIIATGIDNSELSKSVTNNMILRINANNTKVIKNEIIKIYK